MFSRGYRPAGQTCASGEWLEKPSADQSGAISSKRPTPERGELRAPRLREGSLRRTRSGQAGEQAVGEAAGGAVFGCESSEADPDRMRRRMAGLAPATFQKLERAREETRRQRELGWLRGPIQRRRVKWMLGGKTQRAIVWTDSERQRRKAGAKGRPEGLVREPYADIPPWAKGVAQGGDGWRANRKV